MKTLIAEDDFTNRSIMTAFLNERGSCDVAVNGREAVDAFKRACESGTPYDFVCLDISMPEMDGHEALKAIREFEAKQGRHGLDRVKIIMATVHWESEHLMPAFREQCDGYLKKPIDKAKLDELIDSLMATREA